MKKKTLGVLALMAVPLILVSCTHKPYHPDKGDHEWVVDHRQCETWVREGIRADPDTYDNFDEMKMIKKCMREKGWRWERTGLFNPKQETSP